MESNNKLVEINDQVGDHQTVKYETCELLLTFRDLFTMERFENLFLIDDGKNIKNKLENMTLCVEKSKKQEQNLFFFDTFLQYSTGCHFFHILRSLETELKYSSNSLNSKLP